jgi:hypothetical protein
LSAAATEPRWRRPPRGTLPAPTGAPSLFLLTLFACGPGHAETMFEACLTGYRLACACEPDFCARTPEGCCVSDEAAEQACVEFDMRTCDPDGGMYDAALCTYAEDHQNPDVLAYTNCAQKAYAEECDIEAISEECPQGE